MPTKEDLVNKEDLVKYYVPEYKPSKKVPSIPWSVRQDAVFHSHDNGVSNMPYSQLKCFNDPKPEDVDESFMLIRRLARLHLAHLQDEIAKQQQLLDEAYQDRKRKLFRTETVLLKDNSVTQSGLCAMRMIFDKLLEYDEMILQMWSLSQTALSNINGYRCIREYLYQGPPIYMNHAEIGDPRWARYEKEVDIILKDSGAGQWLDSPLGLLLQIPGLRDNDERRQDGPYGPYGESWLQTAWDQTVISGGILFWILHITSALGFILIENASNSDDGFFETLLLGYWYLSAIIILIQGLLAKGLVYARKVFVGGILACLGGLYVLRAWMRISQAASLAAMPAFFTVAILLIRTM